MFVRFRRSHHRLKVYILENVRRDGTIKQEIIAYLGSIDARQLVAEADSLASLRARIAFWETANLKLRGLANQLGPDQQRLSMAIHAKIRWPMQPERDRLPLLEAEHEAEFWRRVYDQGVTIIEHKEQMVATLTKQISADRQQALREIDTANAWAKKAAELRKS